MELHYRIGDQIRTVGVERDPSTSLGAGGPAFRVTIGDRGRRVEVLRAHSGALELRVDGRPVRAAVAEEGPRRLVQFEGGDPLAFLRAESRRPRARRAGAAAEQALTANMHAQVAAVLVREGEVVERGRTLIVLEAMKMELRVIAPYAGRVRSVSCKVGEVVERGRVLAELEASNEEGGSP